MMGSSGMYCHSLENSRLVGNMQIVRYLLSITVAVLLCARVFVRTSTSASRRELIGEAIYTHVSCLGS